jgi:hypothetical protein
MSRTGLAIALVLMIGCNRSSSETAGDTAARPAEAATAVPAADSNWQPVALVGCLRAAEPATPPRAPGAADGASSTNTSGPRFMLMDARPATREGAGVGTQGAGASGGPLVSPRGSYELDTLPMEASALLNKQVEVSGRLDTASAVATVPGGPPAAAPAPRASGSTSATGATGRREIPGGAPPTDPGEPSAVRRIAVDAVKVVAEVCASLG